MAERRAGGYVDRGDGEGWVLDPDQPAPSPLPAAPLQVDDPVRMEPYTAGGWTSTPEPIPEPEPAPDQEPEPAPKPTNAAVRAWAQKAGIEVPRRGSIPREVVDQYLNREQ